MRAGESIPNAARGRLADTGPYRTGSGSGEGGGGGVTENGDVDGTNVMALTNFDRAHTRGFYGSSHGESLERYMADPGDIFPSTWAFSSVPGVLPVEGGSHPAPADGGSLGL